MSEQPGALTNKLARERNREAVSREDYRYRDRPPIARYMGVALVIIGIAALALTLVHFSAPEIPGPVGG